jgi:hypothetical protein|tara:strand:- start:453 stop:854 length:402 start_codon:yes stop_codon:yes gene_type:complete
MVYHVNDGNLFEHIKNHKKIIWFLFRKGQGDYLTLKPFDDDKSSVNLELSEEYPDVVFFQSYISENPLIMEYFNMNDFSLWDYKSKVFQPRIITVKDGQKIYDQAGKKCYCLETLLELVFDLHPELIPIPPSK